MGNIRMSSLCQPTTLSMSPSLESNNFVVLRCQVAQVAPGGPGARELLVVLFSVSVVSSPTEFHHQGSIQSISGVCKIRLPYLGGRCDLDVDSVPRGNERPG